MLSTPISVLGGWPTVSVRFTRLGWYQNRTDFETFVYGIQKDGSWYEEWGLLSGF